MDNLQVQEFFLSIMSTMQGTKGTNSYLYPTWSCFLQGTKLQATEQLKDVGCTILRLQTRNFPTLCSARLWNISSLSWRWQNFHPAVTSILFSIRRSSSCQCNFRRFDMYFMSKLSATVAQSGLWIPLSVPTFPTLLSRLQCGSYKLQDRFGIDRHLPLFQHIIIPHEFNTVDMHWHSKFLPNPMLRHHWFTIFFQYSTYWLLKPWTMMWEWPPWISRIERFKGPELLTVLVQESGMVSAVAQRYSAIVVRLRCPLREEFWKWVLNNTL